MISIRRSAERGHVNHGWLDSYHSFSFGEYHDSKHVQFGSLRVINEDRIVEGAGFGTHTHSNMEIISYVLEGALSHKDSMNNETVIRPGEVQCMTAGSGISHSEHNHVAQTTHFLQIWIVPSRIGLKPSYEQREYPDSEKRGALRLVVSETGECNSVSVHQDVRIYAGLFTGEEKARLELAPGRIAYVHVVRGALSVNDTRLVAGDAAKFTIERSVCIAYGADAEVLVFDLSPLS